MKFRVARTTAALVTATSATLNQSPIGQFTVGLIQPKPYVQRLVLARTATTSAVTSSRFVR